VSRNYKFSDQEKLYFVTFATVNWIDALTRMEYKDIVVDSLNYCVEHKGLEVYSWCIMTNHVHLIIGTNKTTLEDIVRDLKRHTSKSILRTIEENPKESRKDWMLWMFAKAGKKNTNNKNYQFWQQHNHPIELDSYEMLQQRLDYIHNNPVEAGLVDDPSAWQLSSCKHYQKGIKDRIDISHIE